MRRLSNAANPMISDRELWACAQQVLDHHGPDADRFIAERMAALATAEDEAGIRAWRAIAERIDTLRAPVPDGALRH
jgi:hypothetical protein